MPHEVRKKGVLAGTALAVCLALVHTVNDAITAILGALLPTLQARFDASPTTLALIVAVFWIASSVTQPLLAGAGSVLGGLLAPRIGRRRTVVGALSLAPVPLAVVVLSSLAAPRSSSPRRLLGCCCSYRARVKVVIAQELAPHSPASASGMILGMTSAVAGTLYIALGRLQQTIGLDAGMVVGFAMVMPAALLTAIVLARFAEETGSSRG